MKLLFADKNIVITSDYEFLFVLYRKSDKHTHFLGKAFVMSELYVYDGIRQDRKIIGIGNVFTNLETFELHNTPINSILEYKGLIDYPNRKVKSYEFCFIEEYRKRRASASSTSDIEILNFIGFHIVQLLSKSKPLKSQENQKSMKEILNKFSQKFPH